MGEKTLREYIDLIAEMENGSKSPIGGGSPRDRRALAARQIEHDALSEEADDEDEE